MIDFILSKFRRISHRAAAVAGALPAPRGKASSRSGEELLHRDKTVFLMTGIAPRRSCDVLEKRLARDGFFVCRLGMGGMGDLLRGRDIEEMAESLETSIEKMRLSYGLDHFSIIALDVAGLVAAYYVKRLGGDEGCASLVTIGTPHAGVPWLPSGIPKRLLLRAARQVSEGSPFIRRLGAGPFPGGTRVFSIYSRRSKRYPFPSCRLPNDEDANVFNVEVSPVSLDGIMASGSVYAEIRRALAAGTVSEKSGAAGEEGGAMKKVQNPPPSAASDTSETGSDQMPSSGVQN